jgi:hypothetical protein
MHYRKHLQAKLKIYFGVSASVIFSCIYSERMGCIVDFTSKGLIGDGVTNVCTTNSDEQYEVSLQFREFCEEFLTRKQ